MAAGSETPPLKPRLARRRCQGVRGWSGTWAIGWFAPTRYGLRDGARWVRGRLRDASEAPALGERADELHAFGSAVVEQILSGRLEEPADYLQAHDEWVVVLAGAATLEVDGETVELAARDWLFLPSGVPHRLVRTETGTDWLALHLHPPDSCP